MKRYHSPYHCHKKKTTSRTEPTVLSWFLLASAWIIVILFGLYLCLILRTSQRKTEQTAAAFVFAVQTQTTQPDQPPKIQTTCKTSKIPAIHSLRSDKPTILIYHTHTTEAYTQTAEDPYRENGKWRTKDPTKNIVAVGEVLKDILERDYGFQVIHDTTDHEPPKLSTAYERSLVTMQRYHEEYPSIVLFIDLHRDAYMSDTAPCDYLTINGTETARLMLVVGKGEKYEDKPYYASNITFAERITDYLNTIDGKLCRPVRTKTGRYNQHVAPNCILIEVGHNANTLKQAKAAMPYLAESIAYSFSHKSIALSDWLPN